MRPSASTAGVGAVDIARERRNACSAARMSSDRVENSPFTTNESTSWSSLRLHRRAMRASSGSSPRAASEEARDARREALSNTVEQKDGKFLYLNTSTTGR